MKLVFYCFLVSIQQTEYIIRTKFIGFNAKEKIVNSLKADLLAALKKILFSSTQILADLRERVIDVH